MLLLLRAVLAIFISLFFLMQIAISVQPNLLFGYRRLEDGNLIYKGISDLSRSSKLEKSISIDDLVKVKLFDESALGDGAILAFGDVIVDISHTVDQTFLDDFTLEKGSCNMADHHPQALEFLSSLPYVRTPGGAQINTLRVAQWLSQIDGIGIHIGTLSPDDNSDIMVSSMQEARITVISKHAAGATGVCRVAVVDGERTMFTKTGAAIPGDFASDVAVTEALQKAQIVYGLGFDLQNHRGFDFLMNLAQSANANRKLFALNLAAEFIVEFYTENLLAAIEYANIVIGNEQEMRKYGKIIMKSDTLKLNDVALHIAAQPKRDNGRPRIVFITQGSGDTLMAYDGLLASFPVPHIPAEELKDTIGAGDAFVGGLLKSLIEGRSLADSVNAGHYCAGIIIRQIGCTVEGTADFTYSQ